jgi:DNA-binding LacI/PurR family transcriptional regulator
MGGCAATRVGELHEKQELQLIRNLNVQLGLTVAVFRVSLSPVSNQRKVPDREETPLPRNVGLREVAAEVGVSVMTVSLALRNSPKIAERTRIKVKEAAAKLGYRPDPEIARLMSRLRARSSNRSYTSIAVVDLSKRAGTRYNAYADAVLTGALERAKSLGYHAFEASLVSMGCGPERLLSILKHRGVSGIVLLPPAVPMILPLGLNWSDFAVVSTTYAITPDVTNRVVPHQFLDMCRILRRLTAAGFRKIGFAFETDYEARTLYHFTAAITLAGLADMIQRTPLRTEIADKHILPWIKEKRPEVILSAFVEQLKPFIDKVPQSRRPLLYSIGRTPLPDVPFWEQHPHRIGSYAVNVLVGMIQNSEFGLLESPATVMLHGTFTDSFEALVNPHGTAEAERPHAWFGAEGGSL